MIPAFREALYIGRTLEALHDYLQARSLLDATEIVVVTADSPDDTPALAERGLARFPHRAHVYPGPKLGKGRDVRAGMLRATGEFVAFMDADLATPLAHIDALLEALHEFDVVIGCRDLRKIHTRPSRTLSSRIANSLVQTLLLPGIRDSQCGFKGFRRDVVGPLFEPLVTMGWGFDIEILVRARKLGYSVEQLDLPDWCDPKGDDGLAGEVQWAARLRTLRELLSIRRRFGRP